MPIDEEIVEVEVGKYKQAGYVITYTQPLRELTPPKVSLTKAVTVTHDDIRECVFYSIIKGLKKQYVKIKITNFKTKLPDLIDLDIEDIISKL